MPLVLELEQEYARAKADPKFQEEFDWLLKHYVGRPSPMFFAERMTKHYGGAKIYFKRDELKARNRFVLEPGAATWAG